MKSENVVDLKELYRELKSIERWINDNKMETICKYLIDYSIIKSCGMIEKISKKILYEFVSEGANVHAQYYFKKAIIDMSLNPKFERLKKELTKLNKEKTKELAKKCNSVWQKDLDSLVSLRNSFAHGNSISSSISDILKYYKSSLKILDELNKILILDGDMIEIIKNRNYKKWKCNMESTDLNVYVNKNRTIKVTVYSNPSLYKEEKDKNKKLEKFKIKFVPKMLCFDDDSCSICTEFIWGWGVEEFVNDEQEETKKNLVKNLTEKINGLINIGFTCQTYLKEDVWILNDDRNSIIINSKNYTFTPNVQSEVTTEYVERLFF